MKSETKKLIGPKKDVKSESVLSDIQQPESQVKLPSDQKNTDSDDGFFSVSTQEVQYLKNFPWDFFIHLKK